MGNKLGKKATHEMVIATGDRKGAAADNVDVSIVKVVPCMFSK